MISVELIGTLDKIKSSVREERRVSIGGARSGVRGMPRVCQAHLRGVVAIGEDGHLDTSTRSLGEDTGLKP